MMHIQHPESLKAWLTGVLEPLCDADPSALARYVLALLKKEKPVKELQQCMAEQLDVFLGIETEPFVERLFEVIKTEEYKTAADALAETSEAVETDSARLEGGALELKQKPAKECTPPLFDGSNIRIKESAESRNGESMDNITPTASTITSNSGSSGGDGGVSTTLISPITAPHSKDSAVSHGKYSNSREDNHARESRRRRISNHRSRSPRSRSRSYDRSRRSRSRDRRNLDHGRDKPTLRSTNNYNNHRTKSPIVLGGSGRNNRYDNRPKNERPPYNSGPRNASNRNRSPSPSRSLSPDLPSSRRKERSLSPNTVSAMSSSDMEPPKKRQRCRDFDEKGYCMRGETCQWDHGVDPVVLEDINNPALLSIQSGTGSGPLGRPGSGQLHGEYNPDAPDLWNRGGFMPNRGPLAGRLGGVASGNNGPQPVGVFPRAPLGFRGPAAGGGGASGFQFPTNPTATPLQRELIPVPVLDAQGGEMSLQQQQQQMLKKRYEPEDNVAIAEGHQPMMMGGGGVGGGGHKRKLPMNNRLGPRIGSGGPPGSQQQNCSLELRKIPRGLNAIAHLNNHFSKFGKIVNIQISYEGDPEAAIVTFSTHAEANVAYRSTEAVLNNRFIKVFWHSTNVNNVANTGPENNLTASGLTKSENKMSLRRAFPPNQYHAVNNGATAAGVVPATPVPATTDATAVTVSTTSNTPTTTTTVSSTTTPAQTAAIKTSASNAAIISANHLRLKNQRINRAATEIIRKKQEEQVKTAVQLAHGLHKRKHDLLQEYLKQMRSLVELVERTDNTDPQRPRLLETIKELQTSIDNLKKEIETSQAKITSAQVPPQRKTKEQQQKELLDVELELITQEHPSLSSASFQGGSTDTANIRKRYQELQRSLLTARNERQVGSITRAAAGVRAPAPRLAPHGTTSVDRRTTTVQIVGFKAEDADALLGHFKHFGEITKNQLDKEVPFLQITYTTRVNAEQAILRGKKFKDAVLQLSWVTKDMNAPVVVTPNQKPSEQEPSKLPTPTTTPTSSQANADEQSSVDLDMETSSNINLEEEEEEDAELEDRSWRR